MPLDNSIANFSALDVQDQQTILQAVNTLCKNNPHVAAQLAKLADLKENNPMYWKIGLKALKLPG
jgi:ABC-type hemin transport system ATPase subunit